MYDVGYPSNARLPIAPVCIPTYETCLAFSIKPICSSKRCIIYKSTLHDLRWGRALVVANFHGRHGLIDLVDVNNTKSRAL